MLDWDPSRAIRMGKPEKAKRHRQGAWPTTKIVLNTFGTFNAAIHAAGLPTRRAAGNKPNLAGPDAILDAIRIWTLRYGDPPRRTDWDPTRARQTGQSWKEDLYHRGDWPSLPSVSRHFGGLTAAIAACGLEPAPQYESPTDRSARRSRNRLALISSFAQDMQLDGQHLDTAVRRTTAARRSQDPDAIEEALLKLAACAFGLAQVVHQRRVVVR